MVINTVKDILDMWVCVLLNNLAGNKSAFLVLNQIYPN